MDSEKDLQVMQTTKNLRSAIQLKWINMPADPLRPQSTSPGAEVWRLVIHQDLSRTVRCFGSKFHRRAADRYCFQRSKKDSDFC